MVLKRNETIVANHPWVKDVRTEIELLEEEKKENEIKFDSIPFNTDGEGVNNEE